jgi:uncharacterized cupin superfamily protein
MVNIFNILKTKDLRIAAGQPNYTGAVLELVEKFGAKKLGFHLEIIDPKNFSCPYHWHSEEEELFVVLEGEAVVRCNGEFRKVGPGDLIFYKTGEESVHNMYNFTDKPFKFLAIANNSEGDICQYPDSKKISSPDGYMLDGKAVPYFTGEEDPAKYWPAHALRGEV